MNWDVMTSKVAVLNSALETLVKQCNRLNERGNAMRKVGNLEQAEAYHERIQLYKPGIIRIMAALEDIKQKIYDYWSHK